MLYSRYRQLLSHCMEKQEDIFPTEREKKSIFRPGWPLNRWLCLCQTGFRTRWLGLQARTIPGSHIHSRRPTPVSNKHKILNQLAKKPIHQPFMSLFRRNPNSQLNRSKSRFADVGWKSFPVLSDWTQLVFSKHKRLCKDCVMVQ